MKRLILLMALAIFLILSVSAMAADDWQYSNQDCAGIGVQTITVPPGGYTWRLQILGGANATKATNGTYTITTAPWGGDAVTYSSTADEGVVFNGTSPFKVMTITPSGLDANQQWEWFLELWRLK